MKNLKTFVAVIIIALFTSCIPVHATVDQLKSVYTSISNNSSAVTSQQPTINKADSITLMKVDQVPAAPELPSWLDTILSYLKWIIPGLIILLRLIPTSKNLDIIALLNWILDTLIPNLSHTDVKTIEKHTIKNWTSSQKLDRKIT